MVTEKTLVHLRRTIFEKIAETLSLPRVNSPSLCRPISFFSFLISYPSLSHSLPTFCLSVCLPVCLSLSPSPFLLCFVKDVAQNLRFSYFLEFCSLMSLVSKKGLICLETPNDCQDTAVNVSSGLTLSDGCV